MLEIVDIQLNIRYCMAMKRRGWLKHHQNQWVGGVYTSVASRHKSRLLVSNPYPIFILC